MENVIDKETEKEIVALAERYNSVLEEEDYLNPEETESDKLYNKSVDLLYEKLKNKQFVVTKTYSIDIKDIEGIIETFFNNIFRDLNEVIYDELKIWYNEEYPLSAEYKIV